MRNVLQKSISQGRPLQDYLNGISHPRTDSMENLADKLEISVAELASGKEHPVSAGDSNYDQMLSTIPALRSKVLPVAHQTASLMKILFQLPENLHVAENMDIDMPCQDAGQLYCLHVMWDPFGRSLSYGIPA